MLRNAHILFVLLLLPVVGQAQRCGVTDTIPLDAFGTTTLTIPIEGYLNDNLSASSQGLCNVSIYFQHSYVYGLNLTLVSPAGDTVQLVGPTTDQTRPPTTLARWFVDFQQCNQPAEPDPGAPIRWNNTAAFDWPAFGTFQGSYYPSRECFDNFNEGTVNGDWQLIIRNSRAGEQGFMSFLLLEFCDDRHREGPCCFANAGELIPEPPTVSCAEPIDLPLSLPTRYRQPRPAEDAYGYTYLIARNDSVLWAQEDPNLAGFAAGDYELCGLSFRNGEVPLIPLDGSFSPGTLRDNLGSSTPIACADLTQDCRTVRLVPPPDTTFLDLRLCRGGFVRVGSSTYTQTGTYTDALPGYANCDSIVQLNLQVLDTLYVSLDTTICAEGVYRLGNRNLTLPGNYSDTLSSFFGCDSIIRVALQVAPTIDTSIVTSICSGEAYQIGSEPFSESGRYRRVIPAVNGCDSIINLDLIVLDPLISYAPFRPRFDCLGDSVLLDATPSNLSFARDFGWYALDGSLISRSLSITVRNTGTYIFRLEVGTRGNACGVSDTVLITDERSPPTAVLSTVLPAKAARPQVPCMGDDEPCRTVTCLEPVLGIQATILPNRSSYRYRWAGGAGTNIVSGEESDLVFVDAPGIYSLSVLNTLTGCSVDTFYRIGLDTSFVSLDFVGNQVLTCETTEIALTADIDQANFSDLVFEWSVPGSNTQLNGPQLTLDMPGAYSLRVTNTANGCSRDTTFAVLQDIAPVQLNLAPATAPFTCRTGQLNIQPSAADGVNGLRYEWRALGSAEIIGVDRTYTANRAGAYQLTAIDIGNSCRDSAVITIPGDTIVPVADGGPDLVALNCYAETATLGGLETTTGSDIRYQWIEVNSPGILLSENPTLFVEPPPGIYEFIVTDEGNGCVSRDSVRVEVSLQDPIIRLLQPLDFDCFIDSVLIDASNSFRGFNNLQSWTGPCLPANTNVSSVQVECPGTYTYSLLNLENGCSASDTTVVGLAMNGVVAVLPDTVFLDCTTGEARLDRSLSTDAPIVRWFRNGEPIRLRGQAPLVTLPGRYELVLGNFNGSCLDTATSIVAASCPALSIIVPPDSITCDRPVVELDARLSVPDAAGSSSVEWLVPAGSLTQPGTSEKQLLAFTPGRYGFVITNPIGGASDTSYITLIRNQAQPLSEAGARDTISCYVPQVSLDGSASTSGPLYEYLWTTTDDDTIGLNSTVDVNIPGTYLFQVTQTETGCTSVDNVTIIDDRTPPEITFEEAEIPCDVVDYPIMAEVTGGPAHTYQWSGPNLLSAPELPVARVGSAGTYTLTATRSDNGCNAEAQVSVLQAPCPPFPNLSDTSLTCRTDNLILRPSFRDGCTDCFFRWRRNGVVIGGENDSTLLVDDIGTYELTATNRFGLIGTASARVSDNRFVPASNAGAEATLTCKDPTVILRTVSDSDLYPFLYTWMREDGSVLFTSSSRDFTVGEAGNYVLRTTNTFSDCSALDTVSVIVDTLAPIAEAGLGAILTCENKRRVLDGTASSLGRRYTYAWSGGPSIACLEGAATLNPVTRCEGIFTLTVRDTVNGCQSDDDLQVFNDDELPSIIPLPDTSLNCLANTIQLVGGDTSAVDVDYEWQQFTMGEYETIPPMQSATITVDQEGRFRFRLRKRGSGCENDFVVHVAEDLEAPVVEAGPADTFFCGLDSLILSASILNSTGLLDYNWTSATGFAIDQAESRTGMIFQPDIYFFTAFNPRNHCTGFDSISIFRDINAPRVDAGPDTSTTCAQPQVPLMGAFSSESGRGVLSWTTTLGGNLGLPGIAEPVVRGPGTYQFNVTDPVNGCRGADVVVVAADTIRPAARVTGSTNRLLNCYRPELFLDASSSVAANPLEYSWWRNGRAFSADALTGFFRAGDYALVATDQSNGCRDTVALTLLEDFTKPVSTIVDPLDINCLRDSVTLLVQTTVDNRNYNWLNDRDSLLGSGTTYEASMAGIYRLATFDLGNGCSDTTNTIVARNFRQPSIRFNTPPPLNCDRVRTRISARGSDAGTRFTTAWESPDGSGSVGEDPYEFLTETPGIHRFSILDSDNGCSATGEIDVTREAIAIGGFDYEVTSPNCRDVPVGELLILGVDGGSGPFRFRVNGGLLTDRQVYEGLPTGDYTVEVVGSDGCRALREFSITGGMEEAFVRLSTDTTITLGDSILLSFETDLTNWSALKWSNGGAEISDSTNQAIFVRPFSTTNYLLEVVGPNGCRFTDTVLIEVDETVAFYVPTAFSPNGDGTNDLVRPFVGRQVEAILGFQVYDRWGELLYDMREDPDIGTGTWGWNGQFGNSPVLSQQLVWRLDLLKADGSVVSHWGDLVLLR